MTVGISGLHNPPTADKIFPIRNIKGILGSVAQLHNYVCSRNISYIFTYITLRAIFGTKYRLVLLLTTFVNTSTSMVTLPNSLMFSVLHCIVLGKFTIDDKND